MQEPALGLHANVINLIKSSLRLDARVSAGLTPSAACWQWLFKEAFDERWCVWSETRASC